MAASPILLVEDNSDDEALTLRALTKNNIHNEVVSPLTTELKHWIIYLGPGRVRKQEQRTGSSLTTVQESRATLER